MNLLELRKKIDEILFEHPEAKDARVVVDTEARRFPFHLIGVEDIEYEEQLCKFLDDRFVTVYVDLIGSKL